MHCEVHMRACVARTAGKTSIAIDLLLVFRARSEVGNEVLARLI